MNQSQVRYLAKRVREISEQKEREIRLRPKVSPSIKLLPNVEAFVSFESINDLLGKIKKDVHNLQKKSMESSYFCQFGLSSETLKKIIDLDALNDALRLAYNDAIDVAESAGKTAFAKVKSESNKLMDGIMFKDSADMLKSIEDFQKMKF